jgi:hypothetical protein
MTNSPYPSPARPYYKGHSREEDEKLARNLFFGTSTIDKKTGRQHHQYPAEDSQDERGAIEALQRLLICSCGDLAPEILGGLLSALDPGGSFERRLVFKSRKRKRPSNSPTDLQIFFHVWSLERAGLKTESAVQDAMTRFDLSRNAIFEARARVRAESPWLTVTLKRD